MADGVGQQKPMLESGFGIFGFDWRQHGPQHGKSPLLTVFNACFAIFLWWQSLKKPSIFELIFSTHLVWYVFSHPCRPGTLGIFSRNCWRGFVCSTVILGFLGIFWRTRCCFLEVRRCWYCRNLAKKQWWPTAKGGLSLQGWRLKIKNNLSEKTYFQNIFLFFRVFLIPFRENVIRFIEK